MKHSTPSAGNQRAEQHCRIILSDAIDRFKERELTVKGLLRIYFEIKLKPGWEMRKTPKDIYTELGISRAAFYSAFAALREEGKIEADDPDLKLLSIRRPVCKRGQDSTIVDSESVIVDSKSATVDSESIIVDSKSAIVDSESTIVENESPKPKLNKASSDSPSFLSNSYQLFINSLSERETVNFLNFVNERTQGLPQPIANLNDWLAAPDGTEKPRFEGYKTEWEKYLNQQVWAKTSVPCSVDVKAKTLIDELEEAWGTEEVQRLILREYNGWMYFKRNDEPYPVERLKGLTPDQIRAIALG